MDQVIDPDLAAFMARPATLVLATCGAGMRPALARVDGVRLSADRSFVDAFVSRAQWPRALETLTPGAQLALTVCNPINYQTYQIKGRLAQMAAADADDCGFAARYRSELGDLLAEVFGEVGLGRQLVFRLLMLDDLVRLRLAPLSVFLQTPGAGAGTLRSSEAGGAP